MEEKVRVSISIEPRLLERFDKEIKKKKYWNRSEAVRDLIRDYLVEHEWKENRKVIGTVTLLYDHHVRDLTRVLTRHQHRHHSRILSTLHLHLDERYCLEVLVVRGTSAQVREMADLLIGTRGVLHGKLTATSMGKNF